MKKVLIFSALVLMTTQYCHSQNIDLATLKFPLAKSAVEKYHLVDQEVNAAGKYQRLSTTDAGVLNYDKQKLAGKNAASNNFESTNSVTFFNDESTKKIDGYQLKTFTAPESKKLLTSLNTKLGKPGYDYGTDIRTRIWESADKKVLYLFEYRSGSAAKSSELAELKVLNVSATLLVNYFLGAGFSRYKDYLLTKARKTPAYTYTDFLKEMKARGSMTYLQGSNTVK